MTGYAGAGITRGVTERPHAAIGCKMSSRVPADAVYFLGPPNAAKSFDVLAAHARWTGPSRNVCWRLRPGCNGRRRGNAPANHASHDFFLPARRTARSCVAKPSLMVCRARPKASESAGTSRVITDPEAT